MNGKGQAAVMDALYLLLVVTALSVFLFVFSVHYGSSMAKVLQTQYAIDYTSSALKTLLYSTSELRAPSDGTDQFDYLLVIAKQDYFSQPGFLLGDETKKKIAGNADDVMSALGGANDYMLYWYDKDQKTVLFYLKSTDFSSVGGFDCAKGTRDPSLTRLLSSSANRKRWFCDPSGVSAPQSLLQSVGESTQSSAGIRLIRPRSGSDTESVASRVDLVVWPSTCIPANVMQQLNCAEVSMAGT